MRKTLLIGMLFSMVMALGCGKKVQRYGSVIGVKEEALAKYKKLHDNPWPEVNAALKKANVQNYSIYLTQFPDGNYYLFSYMEYVGDDFEGDMQKTGECPVTQEWVEIMNECQLPLENRPEGEWWKSMEEVYHLD